MMQHFPSDDFLGTRLMLSAYVKAHSVANWAALWMRADAGERIVAFDNMMDRPIVGTVDWTRHDIVLDIPELTTQIFFGAMLSGPGKLWFDDFELRSVDDDVPATDMVKGSQWGRDPQNLDFEYNPSRLH
jgi:hypothetical protein